MNTIRQLVVCMSVGVLAGTLSPAAATASESTGQASRADVKAAVMEARRMGTLQPAGEAVGPVGGAAAMAGASMLTREEVRAEVRLARAQGTLVPAGQGVAPYEQPSVSTLARADVKQEVARARRDGELIAAGEGFGPVARVARSASGDGMKMAASRR